MRWRSASGADNGVLFPAVAAALRRPWSLLTGSRRAGYALVEDYAKLHGIKPKAGSRKAKPPAPVASRDFLASAEWRRLRMLVLSKRGARCECCGASPKDGKTVINVDHVKPRKLFPHLALEESNLQVLCDVCNHGKGNWNQTDWRGDMPGDGSVH